MKTAVIYARYSSDSQTEQSIEGQLRVCKEFAERNDIVILDTYIDRAMTGTNDNRAAFQKMLKDSSKGQWDYVLVYKLDRFSRNKYESVIHKKELKDNNVKVLSAMENIPDTPEGVLMESMLEGFNQYYSEELTQKINRGLKESWIKGNSTGGKRVFGYNVVNKKYVINEFEASILRRIFLNYSQGYKAKQIANNLNDEGIKREGEKLFSESYIFHLLHDTKYTGIVEHQGVVYDNIFPRIIDEELWEKVYKITEENKISPSRKKEIFDYILTGKLVCGICKIRMFGESGTSKTGAKYYYYKCKSKRVGRCDCEQKTILKKKLEDLVINKTMELLSSEDNIKFISSKIFEYNKNKELENYNLKILQNRRNELYKSAHNMLKAIEQGIITELTKTRLNEIETGLREVDIDIEKEKNKINMYISQEEIEEFLRKHIFKNCDNIKIRKLIVNTLVRQVILYPDKVIITYNYSDKIENAEFDKESLNNLELEINSAFYFDEKSLCIPRFVPPVLVNTEKNRYLYNINT